jgi:hypothetical protein
VNAALAEIKVLIEENITLREINEIISTAGRNV